MCAARACDGATTSSCEGFANGMTKTCKPSSCDGDKFTPAATCDGMGACGGATTRSCAPYACDANGCKAACTTDADCAAGNQCKMGHCVAKPTATCSGDQLTSTASDGTTKSCPPYLCTTTGFCATMCQTSKDCAPGNGCNAGACQPLSQDSGTASSGGCAMTREGDEGGGEAAFALSMRGCVVAARARSRRARR